MLSCAVLDTPDWTGLGKFVLLYRWIGMAEFRLARAGEYVAVRGLDTRVQTGWYSRRG